jgi:hypothetical protein
MDFVNGKVVFVCEGRHAFALNSKRSHRKAYSKAGKALLFFWRDVRT